MTNRGIHQINTVETVKVAQHNRMTLWNNDGVLTDEALKEFDNNVFDNSELFSYNYLYRQQKFLNIWLMLVIKLLFRL